MSREPDPLPSLLADMRGGNPESARLLDELFRGALHRLCHGYLGDAQLAEDAVQDVFAHALRSRVVPDRVRPWLYRIARNHCLNLLRAKGRAAGVGPLPDDSRAAPAAAQTGFLTALVARERQDELVRAFALLTAGERELLRLRYGEGLPRGEVAEVLDLPEPLVKSRLFEAVARLREKLDVPK